MIVAAGLWLTRNYWFPGRYVVGFDAYAYSGPNALVTAKAIRNWHLPLINEFIFGGVTHFGNPQTGVMYLPRLLSVFMETNRAMGCLVALHVVWLGLGMRSLLRGLAIGNAASTFASVTMMMCGAVLTKAIQFEQILVVAWLPWLLIGIRSLARPDRDGFEVGRRIALLALVTAAVCSAGHPQMTYEIAIVAGIFAVSLLVTERRRAVPGTIVWRRTARIGAGVGLGVAIVLPQMMASLVATRESQFSAGRNLDSLGTSTLALSVRASARSLFGTIRQIRPDVFVGSFETVSYLGVAVVLLALLGLVAAGDDDRDFSWLYGLGIIGLFSAVMSLGPKTFIFRAAFRFVPGFDLARVSARWLVILSFVVCAAAAVGVECLKRRMSSRTFGLFVSLSLIGFGIVLAATDLPDRVTVVAWLMLAVVIVGLVAVTTRQRPRFAIPVIVMLVAFTETYVMSVPWQDPAGHTSQPFTAVRSDLSDWLSEQSGYTIAFTDDFGPVDQVIIGQRPNTNVLLGVRSIDGYDGGVQITKRWAEALSRFSLDPDPELPLRNAVSIPFDPELAARTGIRFVLVDRTRIDPTIGFGWGTPTRSEGRYDLYENPAWKGEARSWAAARSVPRSEIQVELRNGDVPSDLALVEVALDKLPRSCETACPETELAVTRDRPEKISIIGDFAQPSLVTFPVQVGPGWTASVDGEDVPVVALDGLFLGTEVTAGRHTIVFEYRPRWLVPTGIVAVLALVLTLWLICRRHMNPRSGSSPMRRRVVD